MIDWKWLPFLFIKAATNSIARQIKTMCFVVNPAAKQAATSGKGDSGNLGSDKDSDDEQSEDMDAMWAAVERATGASSDHDQNLQGSSSSQASDEARDSMTEDAPPPTTRARVNEAAPSANEEESGHSDNDEAPVPSALGTDWIVQRLLQKRALSSESIDNEADPHGSDSESEASSSESDHSAAGAAQTEDDVVNEYWDSVVRNDDGPSSDGETTDESSDSQNGSGMDMGSSSGTSRQNERTSTETSAGVGFGAAISEIISKHKAEQASSAPLLFQAGSSSDTDDGSSNSDDDIDRSNSNEQESDADREAASDSSKRVTDLHARGVHNGTDESDGSGDSSSDSESDSDSESNSESESSQDPDEYE